MTRKWWAFATGTVTLAAAVRLLAPTVADPDLWGHIRFGERTLSLGLERVDPFSYLSSGTWINHEWLSEVSMALAWGWGGSFGLIVLKTAIALLTVSLVYAHLIRRGSDPLRAGILLIPTLLLLTPGLATVRPQMYTFLFFTLTLLVLHRVETGGTLWAWILPVIIAVWINFHGGVLAGAGVIGIWGIARAATGFARRRAGAAAELARLSVLGLVCAAALLLNPYGLGLPRFLFETGTVPRPDIIEWQAVRIASVPGLAYLAMAAFGGWTLARAPGRVSVPLLAVLAVVTLLPLTAARHLQLFAVAAPVLLADAFAHAWRRTEEPRSASRAERAAVLTASAVVGLALLGFGAIEARCIRIEPERSIGLPMRAVDWLEASGVSGNVATFFDWGEYVLWHLAPDIKVGMDGRRETVYADSIYEEYLRFQNGVGRWRGVLDRPETEMVLFPAGWPATNLTEIDPGWTRVYGDGVAVVFVRADAPQRAALETTPTGDRPPDGAGVCVP
jgi:hypothetical protein